MITQYKAADPLDPTSQAEYKLLAGGATRTWVGTEDAYNAEKNNIPNNTMICITDDNMDFDTYSTSEVKTNKVWIDGKSIYRKVYAVVSGVALYEWHWLDTFGVPQADINSWSKIVSGMYIGVNKSSYTMNLYYDESESHVLTNVLNSDRQNSSVSGDYIVIEYTKTAG